MRPFQFLARQGFGYCLIAGQLVMGIVAGTKEAGSSLTLLSEKYLNRGC